jgi:cytochrome P450
MQYICEARKHHTRDGVKCNYLQVLLDHPLTDDQVVSYSLLTLLVGYHTTSSCLSYTTYQLAANPLEQQKLHSEVVNNSVKRETMFYETVNSLEFLDAVIQESLRLHCLTPK